MKKHYDGWNNGYETKEFKRELEKDVVKWKKAGMSEHQINEMKEYDKSIFCARRCYYEKTYRLYDEGDHLITKIDDYQFHIDDYNDLKLFIQNKRLLKALEKYPAFRDVAIVIANGDADIKSIAKKINKSDNAIHIILFKVRKLSKKSKK